MQTIFDDGDITGTPETTTGPLPVVSADQIGAPSLPKPIQAYRWFIDYGGRHGTLWENRAIRVIPPTVVPFSAYLAAPFVRGRPAHGRSQRRDDSLQSRRNEGRIWAHALPQAVG
jgi:uncharacterized protein